MRDIAGNVSMHKGMSLKGMINPFRKLFELVDGVVRGELPVSI